MNGKSILALIAIVGLAKLAFGSHRHGMAAHGMGSRGRGEWQDRVAEFHRELHRRDAEANSSPAAPAPTAGPGPEGAI